jgi:hypothetical protein
MLARFLTFKLVLRRASTMVTPRYIPLRLCNTEDIENYQPGGYHPISIGDTYDQGRYRILHKLGYGGSSTVWLARDQREGKDCGRIVTLKAMRADMSPQSPGENPKLVISLKNHTVSPFLPLCRLPNRRSPFFSTRSQWLSPISYIPSCCPEHPRHV